MKKIESILVIGDNNLTQFILPKIEQTKQSKSQVFERKNLDGDAASWIITASVLSQSVPFILNQIKEYIKSKKEIPVLKLGEIEIKNPTPEIIERFISTYKPIGDINSSELNKRSIKELISKGQTEEAIEILSDYASNNNNEAFHNNVIILSSRLNSSKEKFILGTISDEETSRERNKINVAILALFKMHEG